MVVLNRCATLALLGLTAVAVAGCVHGGQGGVRIATLGQEVPVREAFMVPPPGGPAIVSVLEQRYTNALAQDIVLQNNSASAGQNILFVRAFGPMGREAGTGTLSQDIPSVAGISREMRQRFPGVAMQVSGLYAQNQYGPIGYATGRGNGVNCIYVWQRIAPEPRLFTFERGSITWRLRLCDPKNSVRELLLIAFGFTVAGYFDSPTWNPYGPPPEPDPRIGKRGVVILPQEAVDPTVVAPVSFGQSRSAAKRARRTRAAARPSRTRTAPEPRPAVLNRPIPGAAVVPRPESTDLSEPAVRGSNLPATAPRAGGTMGVPQAPAQTPPAVPPAVPPATQERILAPPPAPDAPAAPRIILPRQNESSVPPQEETADAG